MSKKPKKTRVGNVVSIRHGTPITPPGEPRPNIIAMAEAILERAKSGDLMGLSVAMHHSDEGHSCWHEGRITVGAVGCLEELKLKLLHKL